MQNDSIETLLLRHFGSHAPAPTHLEARVSASLRAEEAQMRKQRRVASYMREHHVSRRDVIRFVARGNAGYGLLSAGLDGLQMLEKTLSGSEITQTASP